MGKHLFIERLGYIIAPQLILTSIATKEGSRPKADYFVYNDSEQKLCKGKIDRSDDGFYYAFDELNLAMLSTVTSHDGLKIEKLAERTCPSEAVMFTASRMEPYTKCRAIGEISPVDENFI